MSQRAPKAMLRTVHLAGLLASATALGGVKDAHGCLTAAGYEWCEAQNTCIRRWEHGLLSDSDVQKVCTPPYLEPDRCTALALGPKAMEDGSTVVTHTNDCAECDPRLGWVGRRPPGEPFVVLESRFAYPRYVGDKYGDFFTPASTTAHAPQMDAPSRVVGTLPGWDEETYAYLDGVYGIQNERQLSIGESTCTGKLVAKPVYAGGEALLTVEHLTRVAMERCSGAREAVQLMGDLAVEYGYYGAVWEGPNALKEAGEALTVADGHEAWIFHITPDDTGRAAVWCAQRVPDDHIAVVANEFVITRINISDTENFLCSDNVFDVAKRTGLWDGESSFSFKDVFSAALNGGYSNRRVWRVFDLVAPSLALSPLEAKLPFSVKVETPLRVADVLALNRDYYEGTEFDLTVGPAAGAFGDPSRYDAGPTPEGLTQAEIDAHLVKFERAISIHRTSYSTVVQARANMPDAVGGRTWFSHYTPHMSAAVPLYPAAGPPPSSYQRGSLYGLDRSSSFWAFAATGNYAAKWFRYAIEDVRAAQDWAEGDTFQTSLSDVENKALLLLQSVDGSAGDEKAAMTILHDFTTGHAEEVVAFWWTLLDALMGKYHDGLLFDPAAMQGRATMQPQKLFYTKQWLEFVGHWKGSEETRALPMQEKIQPILVHDGTLASVE